MGCTRGLSLAFVGSLLAVGMARADDRSVALEIVDRAIRAHGGEEALTKSQRMLRKVAGNMIFLGKDLPFTADMVLSLPSRYRANFELNALEFKGQMTIVLNADKGWRAAGGLATEVTKEELEDLQGEALVMWLASLVPLRGTDFALAPLPETKFNGQPAAGVKASRKGQGETKLYFDKQSHLLVKVERQTREAGLSVNKEHVFSDHKLQEGLQLAHKEMQFTNGKKVVDMHLKAVKFLPKVEDNVFTKP